MDYLASLKAEYAELNRRRDDWTDDEAERAAQVKQEITSMVVEARLSDPNRGRPQQVAEPRR